MTRTEQHLDAILIYSGDNDLDSDHSDSGKVIQAFTDLVLTGLRLNTPIFIIPLQTRATFRKKDNTQTTYTDNQNFTNNSILLNCDALGLNYSPIIPLHFPIQLIDGVHFSQYSYLRIAQTAYKHIKEQIRHMTESRLPLQKPRRTLLPTPTHDTTYTPNPRPTHQKTSTKDSPTTDNKAQQDIPPEVANDQVANDQLANDQPMAQALDDIENTNEVPQASGGAIPKRRNTTGHPQTQTDTSETNTTTDTPTLKQTTNGQIKTIYSIMTLCDKFKDMTLKDVDEHLNVQLLCIRANKALDILLDNDIDSKTQQRRDRAWTELKDIKRNILATYHDTSDSSSDEE